MEVSRLPEVREILDVYRLAPSRGGCEGEGNQGERNMTTFKGLTEAQQRVFEQIATGNDAGHNSRTLAALVKKGMIEEEKQSGGTYRGKTIFWITRYFVPLPVQLLWCAWCAEQPDEDESGNT